MKIKTVTFRSLLAESLAPLGRMLARYQLRHQLHMTERGIAHARRMIRDYQKTEAHLSRESAVIQSKLRRM